MGAGGCAWVGTGCVGAAAALTGAGAAGARAGGGAGARLILHAADKNLLPISHEHYHTHSFKED